MADQDALLSTIPPAASEAQPLFPSDAQATVEAFLEALATKEPNQLDTITQLSSSSPEVAAFILSLEEAITAAKAATVQGLFLASSLAAGEITQAQFDSAIESIALSGTQLLAATAPILVLQTQSLIAALANSPGLTQLQKLVAAATAAASISLTKLNGPSAGETVPKPGVEISMIETVALPQAPSNSTLETEQTDQKLGNKVDFLTNLINVAAKIAAQNLAASASSLLSLRPQPRIMTGARAVVRINNKMIALCNNIQYEVSTEWQEIRGIDELLPNDLAPTSFSVKGSMSIYRVPSKSPVGDFMQQDMFRGIIWPLTTIEIRDKRTDELIMLVKRAAITSRSETFTKNQLTSTNLSFVGIGFRDEMMPELLADELTGTEDGNGGLFDTFKALANKIF